MTLKSRSRSDAVLGLLLEGGQLEAVVLRRTQTGGEVRKQIQVPLSLDLMRNEPELVGREIRNRLDEAGIRERRCVVGIPAQWILSLQTALPDLPEEDLDSLLELEAERGFPHGVDQLQRVISKTTSGAGAHATQLAVVSEQVRRLEAVLHAARLRPMRLSLAIAALPGAIAAEAEGVITAMVGEGGVVILISSRGGIVALRTFDQVLESEGSERRVLGSAVARELRITLAQLPEELRETVRELRIVGDGPLADQLARDLELPGKNLGLQVSRLTDFKGPLNGLEIVGEARISGALSLAAQFLSNQFAAPDFLPPKPTLWQQLAERYSGRRLAYAGSIGGAVAAAVCLLFLIQSIQLSRLESKWTGMAAKTRELEDMQSRIRTFRPWDDRSLGNLQILQKVTEAFPEEGSVTAKTLEIRNQAAVSVTGVTRDNSALLKTLDQLRTTERVADLKVDTIRGKSPMQFTFNFQWEGPK